MDSQPWWDRYRKAKYKPRNRLTLEMIIRKSFVETVKEYITASSIAGMRHITAPNHSVLQRLFWLGLLLSFLGVVIYFLQYTWMATLTKPLVVTGESFTFPIEDIDFPAVALCNVNRISNKALEKLTVELYPKLAKLNTTVTNLRYFLKDMGRLIDFDYDQTWGRAKLIEIFALRPYSDQTVELMKASFSGITTIKKCRMTDKYGQKVKRLISTQDLREVRYQNWFRVMAKVISPPPENKMITVITIVLVLCHI